MLDAVELAIVGCSMHLCARLECAWRVAGALGFGFGAMLEARFLALPISAGTAVEWMLRGAVAAGILFQREISELVRRLIAPQARPDAGFPAG